MQEGLEVEESDSEVVEERRQTDRIETEFPVRVQAPKRAEGTVLELSTGGLRLELGEDLSHAIHLSLEFQVPDSDRRIGVLADVRWHKQLGPKSEPRWIYGLRFADLSPSDEDEIRALIEAQRVGAEISEAAE